MLFRPESLIASTLESWHSAEEPSEFWLLHVVNKREEGDRRGEKEEVRREK